VSKIDDQLAHSIYCGVWEAHHNDDGELQSGPCSCDLQEARAELAALRQRAEDAEMIVKANADRDGNWYFERLRSGKWRLNNYGDTHHDDVEIDLETNPATGLPILTAEARIALGRKT